MKIIVIEDYQLIRDMLVVTCSSVVPGAEARGAANGTEGVAICREFQPDVIFLDLVLPDCDGIDLLPALHASSPGAKIIALTSHADEFTLHRALRANVNGFVDKNEQPLLLLKEAVHTVLGGRAYFSTAAQRLRAAMRNDPSGFSKVLSEREQDLLALFGEGFDNDEIASRTGIARGTVRNHRSNIMAKLGIHSTPELMRYAIEKGFTRMRRAPEPVHSSS